MDKTRQAVSVLAICASILLAGMMIAYKPGVTQEPGEYRFPTGVPPTLGATGFKTAQSDSSLKTLSISGTGVVYVKADQATVILGTYTEDKLASRAIDENAAKMASVIAALKKLGIKDDEIQTSYYNVQPNYNWEIRQVVGYQVTNMIQVKFTDLNKIGSAIDTASAAGANRVDSVGFGIKEATAAKAKMDAYVAAITDAKAKKDVITTNLDITTVGVQSVTESVYYPSVAYRSYDAVAGSEKASTPILGGNLSVTVTLNIVYLIN